VIAACDGIEIRDLELSDHDSVRILITQAFGQADEADLVAAIRQTGDTRFELVAVSEGVLTGHIMICRGRIETMEESGRSMRDVAILGEMAVAPERQNRGIGTALVQAALARLDAVGAPICFVVGYPDYYPRFGFSAQAAAQFSCKWQGPAFMARITHPQDWMQFGGFLHFPKPYDRFE